MSSEIGDRTVTIVYTDLERSTTLWEEHPDEMTMALRHHFDIIERAVEDNSGRIFQSTGDGYIALFDEPEAAVLATATAQRELAIAPDEGVGRLKARMGIHTGACKVYEGQYYGRALNLGARLHTAAHGDQVLVSGATAGLVGDKLPGGLSLVHLGEYWLRDIRSAEQVHQLVGPGLVADFPELTTRTTAADELPRSTTTFVGRQDELTALEALIGDHGQRCVSLIGGAGVGKTRLALHLAQRLWKHYRDGVVWVELGEDAAGEQGLAAAVANKMGIHLDPEQAEPLTTTAAALASTELLLVLDNCEIGLDGARQLATAVAAQAPGVAILTTSREALHIGGEIRWAVQPLAVGEGVDLHPSPALQLFEERAAAVRPDLQLDDSTRAIAHDIVSNLDGLPLAIEQAAAVLDVSTLEEVSAATETHELPRLSERERLAESIERSIRHLSGEETELLSRLPIFAGAIHATGVAGVCLGQESSEQRAQVLLARLARSSLIHSLLDGGRTYYRMLPPVRSHVLARSVSPEHQTEVDLVSAHREYFRQLALAEGRAYRAGDQRHPAERLAASWEDIRTAFFGLLESREHGAAAEVVEAVHDFALNSLRTEVYRWAGLVADHVDDLDLGVSLRGIVALGAWSRGSMNQSLELATAALDLGGSRAASRAANRTAMNALSYLGRMDEAADHFFALLDSCRYDDEAYWRLDGVASEAIGLCLIGDYTGAERLARSAVEFATTLENQDCLYWSHYVLGHALAPSDARAARAAFERAIEEADSIGSHWNRMNGRLELLVLSRRHDQFDMLNVQTAWELLGRFALAGVGAQVAQLSMEIAWMLAKSGHRSLAADLFSVTLLRPRMPRPGDDDLVAQVATAVADDGRGDQGSAANEFVADDEVVAMCRHGLTLLLGHGDDDAVFRPGGAGS